VPILDFNHLVDLLITSYSGPNTTGSALFPFTLSNSVDLDLDAILVALDCHPVDFLERYQGPPDLIALGLVSGGWAAPIDSKVRPSAHPDAKRIVTACVAGVDGTIVDRIRMPDGSVINPSKKEPGFGAVPDALRAALWRTAA
jgi:hypothetical protein